MTYQGYLKYEHRGLPMVRVKAVPHALMVRKLEHLTIWNRIQRCVSPAAGKTGISSPATVLM